VVFFETTRTDPGCLCPALTCGLLVLTDGQPVLNIAGNKRGGGPDDGRART